jgi:hypothetical protein
MSVDRALGKTGIILLPPRGKVAAVKGCKQIGRTGACNPFGRLRERDVAVVDIPDHVTSKHELIITRLVFPLEVHGV